MSVSGVCLFGYLSTHVTFIPEFLSAVMGKEFTVKDMLDTGERISNIRQAFNVREGINPVTQPLPERAFGRPPLQDGPTAGLNVEVEAMVQEYLEDMGWTEDAAIPCEDTLVRIGLADVANDLWPKSGND
jgi:aldehyde:ferredoxin oxidoreductase